ncbi:indole-3-glycerol phosphate synthase TrpC [Allobacillus sp. GCM10007491]|uniref:Indole-3-glycerol phosphate synthase n=1 Tax=Allobacillus saliphilus TaxID=2912308 RepID=A0A941CVL5_9BACI|nr:indole-3-glycerol phosphate synthase TrpC [Allobacillus saliphilus]MBR7553941.1 indole-3-glycerol phosphate synthase TrpC [Allobacillus saliphilus]
MNILDEILIKKQQEITELKRSYHRRSDQKKSSVSLYQSFQQSDRMSIIAEFKRASPSKGLINVDANPESHTKMYEQFGANAVSVLTDRPFFKGTMGDLQRIRQGINIPVLNKDFILDEIQIDRALDYGADVILLIAAAMKPARLEQLYRYATGLGLEVLLEIHTQEEATIANDLNANIVGINNRDLKTFDVDLATTERLAEQIQDPATLLISESGIKTTADVERVQQAGVRGILVGETMMQSSNLKQTFDELRIPINEVSLHDR